MAFVDPNTIHNPATGTSPPATWGDQVRDNDIYLYERGPYICTSATRPGSPFDGQQIYETDTNRALIYNGSAWTGLRSVAFSQVGTGITTSAAATSTTNTLSIPDQGCAGTLMICCHVRVDKSNTSDLFKVEVRNGASTDIGHDELANAVTINYAHITTALSLAAGATGDVRVMVTRSSGSGTATTYTDGLVNRLDVTFVPTG